MEEYRREVDALGRQYERERAAEIEANRHFNLPKDPEVLRRAEAAAEKYLSSPQETFAKPPSGDSAPERRPEVACRFQQGMDDYCFTHKQVHERPARGKRPGR